MSKQMSRSGSTYTADRAIGAERAAAILDRNTWLNCSPKRLARDYQLAHALTDALIRSPHNRALEQRIAQNVRTMR